LTEQIVAVVQETMQPAQISLWLLKPGHKEVALEDGSLEEVVNDVRSEQVLPSDVGLAHSW
jgi:hypothetical protein